MTLSAPFPYFGAKAKIAEKVWLAMGDVGHYIEPFAGSLAVLLSRPDYDYTRHIETVADINCYISNVWRSISFSPDEVAKYCDYPVNHVDLEARRRVLSKSKDYLTENLASDPEWYNAKLAGYWVWAASCSVGSELARMSWGNPKHPGDLRSRPELGGGNGIFKLSARGETSDWINSLSKRLRHVRVVCGDWTRVCQGKWQSDVKGYTGVYLDPPYAVKDRDDRLYGDHDSTDMAHDVRKWCIERGADPGYRIILSGYEEHEELAGHEWRKETWKAQGGYAVPKGGGQGQGKENRKRETLWYSPYCIERQYSFGFF